MRKFWLVLLATAGLIVFSSIGLLVLVLPMMWLDTITKFNFIIGFCCAAFYCISVAVYMEPYIDKLCLALQKEG